jgi:primary-amine oxidase
MIYFIAHPLGFIAIVDMVQKRVLGIEDLPIHGDFDVHNREGDEIPLAPHNFEPTSLPLGFFRKDVSPIDISQVAGPSFKIVGRQVEWQNFKLRVGYVIQLII